VVRLAGVVSVVERTMAPTARRGHRNCLGCSTRSRACLPAGGTLDACVMLCQLGRRRADQGEHLHSHQRLRPRVRLLDQSVGLLAQ
jgi:hypothetical protein